MVYGSLLRGLQVFGLCSRKSADSTKMDEDNLVLQLESLGI